mgnify:CR=1 FL=1
MFYHVVIKGKNAVWIQAARSKSDAQQAVINLTVRSAYERTDAEPFSVRSFWTKAGAAKFIKQSLGCQ